LELINADQQPPRSLQWNRRSYSTAGRPRVRGEYKCGKCGFYPKKSRHDCDDVKVRPGVPFGGGSPTKHYLFSFLFNWVQSTDRSTRLPPPAPSTPDHLQAKSAAGICIEQQVQASEAKAAKRARKGRNDNTSPSGTGTMLYGSDEGRSPNGVAPAKLRYEVHYVVTPDMPPGGR